MREEELELRLTVREAELVDPALDTVREGVTDRDTDRLLLLEGRRRVTDRDDVTVRVELERCAEGLITRVEVDEVVREV